MGEKTEKLLSILKLQPVVPVLIVDDVKSGVSAGARAGRGWAEGDRNHHAHAGGARCGARRCGRSRRC